MADPAAGIHTETAVPISLPERAEGARCRSVPHDKTKKNLFIQAPTGVGKTISTVFPAVKAVGENLGDRIFYLTAKTITGTVAREAFELLRKGGYQAKIIQITAKEKLCMCDGWSVIRYTVHMQKDIMTG